MWRRVRSQGRQFSAPGDSCPFRIRSQAPFGGWPGFEMGVQRAKGPNESQQRASERGKRVTDGRGVLVRIFVLTWRDGLLEHADQLQRRVRRHRELVHAFSAGDSNDLLQLVDSRSLQHRPADIEQRNERRMTNRNGGPPHS